MVISTKKSRSASIVILAALLMGSLSSAAWTFQDPKRAPTVEELRKQVFERMAKQLATPAAKPAAANPARQPQPQPPPPAPTTPPTPTPAPTQPPTATPPAASTGARDSGKIVLNIENADLYDFINNVAGTLNLTPLIIDPEVKGTVNLSSGSISKDDLMPLFSIILKNNNAALIRQGNTYQVIPISSAVKRGVEIIERLPYSPSDSAQPQKEQESSPKSSKEAGPGPAIRASSTVPVQTSPKTALSTQIPEGDSAKSTRLATHVIRLEFIPVKDLVEPITKFMTEGGVIMVYERLNMLILTDYTDNVNRILQIVRMLDTSYLDPDLVELVKIENNASSDIVDDLKKMFGSGSKDSPTGISFVSMDRMNAIFLMASSKRALEEVKGWIRELDSSSAKNIQTYVYAVQNSTASNIAMMLSALYGGEGSTSNTQAGAAGQGQTTGGNVAGGTRGSMGNQGGFGGGAQNSPFATQAGYQNNQFGGYNGGGFGGGMGMGGGAFGAGRQLGPQLNVNRTVSSQVLKGGQFSGLQDTVRLVVDDINNSLIIQATAADYAYISDTIKKMDVLPRQALIDAKIFEVDLVDDLSVGVEAALQPKGTATNTLTTAALKAGAVTAQTFMPIGNARELLATLSVLRSKTKVKILESPSVLALDGQVAQIMVGQEYPYPNGTYTPSVGGSTTNVSYRDTGINLQVIPRISASGSVTLDLVQEVSAPGLNRQIGDTTAPSFNKTSVQTTLTVKDGETVAIAGLIRDNHNFDRSGIPFLSDIPLLGSLFGQTNRNTQRVELIIMITPHVIRTPEALNDMTLELKDSLHHARKWVDEKNQQRMEDVREGQEERQKQEQKQLKKVKSPKPEAEATKPKDPVEPPKPE